VADGVDSEAEHVRLRASQRRTRREPWPVRATVLTAVEESGGV